MELLANNVMLKLLIFENEIHKTQLITEMVSNGLPQVPNKKLQHMSILFCLYKGIGADS